MYCNKCGKKIPDDSEFCPNCGNKLVVTNNKMQFEIDTEVVTPDINANNPEKNFENQIVVENVQEDGKQVSSNHFQKKNLVFIISALGIIAILIFTILGGTKMISVDSRNECNFHNGGQVAYDNENLYFVGNFDKNDKTTSLYSTSYSGTNKKLLSDNGDITRIKIAGNKIIFASKDGEDKYLLGTMNKDGTEEKEIVSFNADSTPMCFDIYKNEIFYISDDKINKCNLDGTANVEIVDATSFTLAGKVIYYTSKDMVLSYDLKSEKTVELCKSSADYLIIDDETMYFKNDKGLYCVSIKGGVANKITTGDAIDNFVIDDGTIYFVKELTIDEIKSLAKYMEDDDNNYLYYAVAMIKSGQLKSVKINEGRTEDVKSDQLLMTNLYTTPQNYYCKNSIWSTTFEIVNFE